MSAKFKYKDLKLLEIIIGHYIETAPLDEIGSQEAQRLLNFIYRDEKKILTRQIKALESKGYKIEKI